MSSQIEPRRAATLVGDLLDASPDEAAFEALPGASALVLDAAAVVVEAASHELDPERLLGGVLMWLVRRDVASLTFLASAPTAGVHARRLDRLDLDCTAHSVTGRSIEPATPEPLAPVARATDSARERARQLADAGLEVVEEHGVMRGELRGLEVARVVDRPEGPVVEVGIGGFDREAMRLVHGDSDTTDQLERVIEAVSASRVGAGSGDVANAARERWLRSVIVADPSLVGVDELTAVEPAVERSGLRVSTPAPAVGRVAGQSVLVVATAGVDPAVVPVLVDLIERHRPDRSIVAAPERDCYDALRSSIGLVADCELVGVRAPWTTSTGAGST